MSGIKKGADPDIFFSAIESIAESNWRAPECIAP